MPSWRLVILVEIQSGSDLGLLVILVGIWLGSDFGLLVSLAAMPHWVISGLLVEPPLSVLVD